jgi:anti-sigma B factor antagonist
MTFSMTTQRKENCTEIELQGEIDVYVSPDFKDKLFLACNESINGVIVDLSQVSFMDSSGVATLLEGLKWSKKKGKSFVLKNISTNLMGILSLSKLETVFKIISVNRKKHEN